MSNLEQKLLIDEKRFSFKTQQEISIILYFSNRPETDESRNFYIDFKEFRTISSSNEKRLEVTVLL